MQHATILIALLTVLPFTLKGNEVQMGVVTHCSVRALQTSIAAGAAREQIPSISLDCATTIAADLLREDSELGPYGLDLSLAKPARLARGRTPPILRTSLSSERRSVGMVVGEQSVNWSDVTLPLFASKSQAYCKDAVCTVRYSLVIEGLFVDATSIAPGMAALQAELEMAGPFPVHITGTPVTVARAVAHTQVSVTGVLSQRLCGVGSTEMVLHLQEMLPSAWNVNERTLELSFDGLPDGVRVEVPSEIALASAADGRLLRKPVAGVEDYPDSQRGKNAPTAYTVVGGRSELLDRVDIPIIVTWEDAQGPHRTVRLAVGLGTGDQDGAPRSVLGAVDVVTFLPCESGLVYPFVTSTAGFDTGISITNASTAWPDVPPHSGMCTLVFDPSNERLAESRVEVALEPDEQLNFLLSQGDVYHGIPPLPDFVGHIIARCNIAGVRGFAYVTKTMGGATDSPYAYLPATTDLETTADGRRRAGLLGGARGGRSLKSSGASQALGASALVSESRPALRFSDTAELHSAERPSIGQAKVPVGPEPHTSSSNLTASLVGPHAATHAQHGSDPVSPESIGAARDNNATIGSADPDEPALTVIGSPNQTAPLQVWRDGNGDLVSVITSQGSAFFRELGLASPIGADVVSLHFETGGKRRFAASVNTHQFSIVRYDDSGQYKDAPLTITRNGTARISSGVQVSSNGGPSLRLEGAYIDFPSILPPSPPPSGEVRLYLDRYTSRLSVMNSDGVVLPLFGHGEHQDAQRQLGSPDGPYGAPSSSASRVRETGQTSLAMIPSVGAGFSTAAVTPHANTHSSGGTDPLTARSIGALRSTEGRVTAIGGDVPALMVQGMTDHAGPIQVWQHTNGAVVAMVDGEEPISFTEMGVASKVGANSASVLFETAGVRRHSITASASHLDISRFDEFGGFDGIGLRLARDGLLDFPAGLRVKGPTGSSFIAGGHIRMSSSNPEAPTTDSVRLFVSAETGVLTTIDSAQHIEALASPQALSPSRSGCVAYCRPYWRKAEVPDFPMGGDPSRLRSGDGCACFSLPRLERP